MNPPTVCVIPARYGATRFPGKVLADLGGKPVIQHVYERASRAEGLDRLLVATDDERIAEAIRRFGGEWVMTPSELPSGTDRVAYALRGVDAGIVVNLQGDEPLIDPVAIERLVRTFNEDPGVQMASVMCPLSNEGRFEDPNVVKVVVSARGDALYFSRAPIPHSRSGDFPPCFQHIGIYGFRRKTLDRFVEWPPGRLEQVEKLEQLRALENGVAIRMVEIAAAPVGVDTPEDLERVRAILESAER
jgi:3-deoxy-manno-octulosonate cytidylyltransferase (CMP-KDO synthetase)